MKKIFIFAFLFFFASVAFAGSDDVDRDGDAENDVPDLTDPEIISSVALMDCNDPELEWNQADEKTHKVLVTKKGLELESKKDDICAFSTCEISKFNPEIEDFIVRFVLEPNDISDDKTFGVIFDYKSKKNYKSIIFKKKKFELNEVVNGVEDTMKENIYKLKNKKKSLEVDLVRYEGKLYVFVNGLEIFKTASPQITNSSFGFIVGPKNKMLCRQFGFAGYAIPENED